MRMLMRSGLLTAGVWKSGKSPRFVHGVRSHFVRQDASYLPCAFVVERLSSQTI